MKTIEIILLIVLIISALFVLIALATCAIFLIISVILHNKTKNIVFKKSQRIKNLLNLNKTIHFKVIKPSFAIQYNCRSKKQIDHLSINKFFINSICSHEIFYNNIVECIVHNKITYANYKNK